MSPWVFPAVFGAFPHHRSQAAAVNRLASDARMLSEASERVTWWHEDSCLASGAQKTTRDGPRGLLIFPIRLLDVPNGGKSW